MNEEQKQCTKCAQYKSIYEFAVNPRTHQLGLCKECNPDYVSQIARSNREYEWSKAHDTLNVKYRNPKRYKPTRVTNRVLRSYLLPRDLTQDDWICCLNYFNNCCAACGKQLNHMFGDVRAAKDHWIPLSYKGENPGTTKVNIVPLCYQCNTSKAALMPHVWLHRHFGKRKAQLIAAKIQAYFDYIRTS